MSANREKTYALEFRESSVKLAIESKNPITQTARELRVKASTLHTWISKHASSKSSVIIKLGYNKMELKLGKK